MFHFAKGKPQSRRSSVDLSDDGESVPDAAARTRRLSYQEPGRGSASLRTPPRSPNIQEIQQQLRAAASSSNNNAVQLQKGLLRKRHNFSPDAAPSSITSAHLTVDGRHEMIRGLLAAKEATGKSFTELSVELGLANAYTAQLFYNQAQLRPSRVAALRRAVPGLTEAQLAFMQRSPLRLPEQNAMQDPSHRVLQEALALHATAIKAIMNEEWGDVVLSPADVAAAVSLTPGKNGEQRFTLTLSGKFMPYQEQEAFNPNGFLTSPLNGPVAGLPSMPEE